ncbi:UNVERIFIED_CONTAM: hypothetical protein FKN15_030121 [Acipenser sinensis]
MQLPRRQNTKTEKGKRQPHRSSVQILQQDVLLTSCRFAAVLYRFANLAEPVPSRCSILSAIFPLLNKIYKHSVYATCLRSLVTVLRHSTTTSLSMLRNRGVSFKGQSSLFVIIHSQITTTSQTRENEHLIYVNKINTGTTTQSDPDLTDSAIRSTTQSGFLDSGQIDSTADPTAESFSPSASTDLNPTASESEISTGKEVPKAATVSKPLPLAGSLPTPITDVSGLCPCDLLEGQCDVNCCCDPYCEAEITHFTTCLVQKLIVNNQLCSQQAAVYSLNVTNSSTQRTFTLTDQVSPDVFCIQTANYESGLSFTPPEVPTDSNFDSLVRQFIGYFFSSAAVSQTDATSSSVESQAAGYKYADLIRTLSETNGEGFLKLPTTAATSQCADSNPAAFLENQATRCSRRFSVATDCTTLSALNLQSYQDFRIRSLVSISVSSITVQSLDGSRSRLDTTDVSSYPPEPLQAGTVCNNVVLQVSYLISYNDTGAIVDAKVSFILGALNSSMVPVSQSFQITFVQSCNIPLSLDIVVQWTKYGSLVNPQAQIVNVTEKINSISLVCHCSDAVQHQPGMSLF